MHCLLYEDHMIIIYVYHIANHMNIHMWIMWSNMHMIHMWLSCLYTYGPCTDFIKLKKRNLKFTNITTEMYAFANNYNTQQWTKSRGWWGWKFWLLKYKMFEVATWYNSKQLSLMQVRCLALALLNRRLHKNPLACEIGYD